MDTKLSETFLEVSRMRHFGRTVESLYLTQSTVGSRIRWLENQPGVNSFTRHRNNIHLVATGEKPLPYAGTLMSTWQAARKEMAHTPRHNEFPIDVSASLWECMLNQQLGRLYQNQDVHTGLQFRARIAQRQPPVKQLHECQLDLLITTEAPKMDEFCSQLLGYLILALHISAPSKLEGDLNHLRLRWGPDFQQYKVGLIDAGEVPTLTISSAELAQQQITVLSSYTWPPVNWVRRKGGLHTVVDSTTLSRPLYAIWLQNNDKNTSIHDPLKINVLDEVYQSKWLARVPVEGVTSERIISDKKSPQLSLRMISGRSGETRTLST